MNKRRGQSTVEYLVLVTAVIAVIFVFVASKKEDSPFQKKLTNTLTTMADQMTNVANRLGSTTP